MCTCACANAQGPCRRKCCTEFEMHVPPPSRRGRLQACLVGMHEQGALCEVITYVSDDNAAAISWNLDNLKRRLLHCWCCRPLALSRLAGNAAFEFDQAPWARPAQRDSTCRPAPFAVLRIFDVLVRGACCDDCSRRHLWVARTQRASTPDTNGPGSRGTWSNVIPSTLLGAYVVVFIALRPHDAS